MIHDPYAVLGVSESAGDDELKKAYREKSKKWHPDSNPGNTEYAEKRFKEVQEAYRQIVDARARGESAYGPAPGSAGSYGSPYGSPYQQSAHTSGPGTTGYAEYGYGSFADFFREWEQYSREQRQAHSQVPPELASAVSFINSGQYRDALTALSQIAPHMRSALWYYLAAVSSQRVGNNIDALNFAKQACDMEPDNPDYQRLLASLQGGGTWYQNRNSSYSGFNPVSSPTTWCLSMCALNLCLNGFCC